MRFKQRKTLYFDFTVLISVSSSCTSNTINPVCMYVKWQEHALIGTYKWSCSITHFLSWNSLLSQSFKTMANSSLIFSTLILFLQYSQLYSSCFWKSHVNAEKCKGHWTRWPLWVWPWEDANYLVILKSLKRWRHSKSYGLFQLVCYYFHQHIHILEPGHLDNLTCIIIFIIRPQ